MRNATNVIVRKLRDTTGQPVNGLTDRRSILGYPAWTDPFMPAMANGVESIAFGDMSKYFIRIVNGVRFERSDEFKLQDDLIAFRCILRLDGALVDTGAVWACVNLIARASSTLPLYAYRRGDRDPLPDLPPILRQPSATHEPARLPLFGPLLPWQVPARVYDQGRLVTQTFQRGALAGTDPARVPLTATHPKDAGTLPIGVMVELEERADAAHGAWHVSDTMIGNEVLALARDRRPGRRPVVEVAIGGLETGPLRVLCRGENGRRSTRVLDVALNRDPSPAEPAITHRDGDDPGPVAA
jgi:hypothetical protein